jgi:hypothetical protein
VLYKVCIDIPIEAYRAAGVPIFTNRWIPGFFGALARMPGWHVWSHGRRPSTLLDGDIVAASNPDHQHAGIVATGLVYDSIINLPGPTAARRYGMYEPSGQRHGHRATRAVRECPRHRLLRAPGRLTLRLRQTRKWGGTRRPFRFGVDC